MGSRTYQGPMGSVNSARLEALLDKLVALQLDLEPICGSATERRQTVTPLVTIAEACETLHSAIADVRDIICQAEGLVDLPDARADQDDAQRGVV